MKALPALILVAGGVVAAGGIGGMYVTAEAKEMSLPNERVLWRESSLPGYQKVQQQCTTCHSAHYAEYQPRSTSRNYWESQVKRMKTVFNAPIPDADIADITDYLFATYSDASSGKGKK